MSRRTVGDGVDRPDRRAASRRSCRASSACSRRRRPSGSSSGTASRPRACPSSSGAVSAAGLSFDLVLTEGPIPTVLLPAVVSDGTTTLYVLVGAEVSIDAFVRHAGLVLSGTVPDAAVRVATTYPLVSATSLVGERTVALSCQRVTVWGGLYAVSRRAGAVAPRRAFREGTGHSVRRARPSVVVRGRCPSSCRYWARRADRLITAPRVGPASRRTRRSGTRPRAPPRRRLRGRRRRRPCP